MCVIAYTDMYQKMKKEVKKSVKNNEIKIRAY